MPSPTPDSSIRSFTNRRTVLPASMSAARAANLASQLNFSSIRATEESLGRVRLRANEVSAVASSIFERSPTNALKFCKAVLNQATSNKRSENKGRALIQWGRDNSSTERRIVCTAFKQRRQNILMIHGIAELKKKDARAFMKDYFAVGGDMKSVAQWLQLAGHVLRKHKVKSPGTDGDVVDWVVDTVEDGVDAAGNMVTSVVDAVVDAGKAIAEVISETVNWTADQIKDFVAALIEAGKTIAEILSSAVSEGTAVLKKYVRALVETGTAVAEILTWAVSRTASVLRDTVSAMFEAGKAVAEVLSWAVGKVAATIKKIVKAILDAGKAVATIVQAILDQVASAVNKVIRALIELGITVRAILITLHAAALDAVKKVVSAILAVGKTIADILKVIASTLNKAVGYMVFMGLAMSVKVINALLELGQTVAQLMVRAVSLGLAVVSGIARALASAGHAVLEILQAVVGRAQDVIRATVQGLVRAGKKAAEIIASATNFALRDLKKIVIATYNVTKTIAGILINVVTSTPSIIMTVLEGLLKAGAMLTETITAIVKDIANEFRKGLIEGLIALGKGALEILKAAAKAGGAVLGLTFAVLMEIWGGHRSLTQAEKDQARRVFGWSIDLDRVKVAVASIPADVVNWLNGGRPFTTMYIINFASWDRVDMATLIHELTHVWQAVTSGPIYMVEALHSQYFGEGYEVTEEDITNANGDLSNLEREQQAVVVERYWRGRWGGDAYIDWEFYYPLAKNVYKAKPGRPLVYSDIVPVTGRVSWAYVPIR